MAFHHSPIQGISQSNQVTFSVPFLHFFFTFFLAKCLRRRRRRRRWRLFKLCAIFMGWGRQQGSGGGGTAFMNKRFSSVLRPHAVPHSPHLTPPLPPPHKPLHRKAFSLNLLCFWPCPGANNKRQVHTATPSAHALAGTLHQQQQQ